MDLEPGATILHSQGHEFTGVQLLPILQILPGLK